MRRYREHTVVAFVLALLCSLAVHLPVYEVLGALADVWQSEAPPEPESPVAVDFTVDDGTTKANPADARHEPAAKPPPPERRHAAREAQPTPPKPDVAERQPEVKPPPAEPPPDRQAIEQHSEHPDETPPPDTRFVAAENNRVEEETAARIRNYDQDTRHPQAGRQRAPAPDAQHEGNAPEQHVADLRAMQGSHARTPTLEETRERRPREAPATRPARHGAGEQSAARAEPNFPPVSS